MGLHRHQLSRQHTPLRRGASLHSEAATIIFRLCETTADQTYAQHPSQPRQVQRVSFTPPLGHGDDGFRPGSELHQHLLHATVRDQFFRVHRKLPLAEGKFPDAQFRRHSPYATNRR